MINRTLLRIKIVQIVYSYYLNKKESGDAIEKELFFSLQQTYNLYFYLLLLVGEITRYAQNKIEIGKNKYLPNEAEKNPNTKFAENAFAYQLSANKKLQEMADEYDLTWENNEAVVKNLFLQIENADFYKEYMESGEKSYAEDKEIWRKIFKRIIPVSDMLGETLEDQNIYWNNDDADIVLSFVIKTIKFFDEKNGENQELLPMFKDNEDVEYAKTLLHKSILKETEWRALIDRYTKNWDIERIAFMDIVIMQIALTEITVFPRIPVNVSMNEYIELAKNYSTDKSGAFVNGVLDKIISDLKKDNKITKVTLI